MTDLKQFIQQYYASWDSGDGAWQKMLSPDVQVRFNGSPPMDLEAFQGMVAGFEGAFSGFKHAIDLQAVEGDTVFSRLMWSAKHTGEFEGVAATGNDVSCRIVVTHTVRDGLIEDYEVVIDMATLMGQLQGN